MQEARAYCKLIHKARDKAGFNSLKYPVTDVKVNRYFLPEYRDLIAEECNITGYYTTKNITSVHDGIPAVEYEPLEFDDYEKNEHYVSEEDSHGRKVHLSTIRSKWQQELYDIRTKEREAAVDRKNRDLAYTNEYKK